jgi:hypothetical protein
MENTPNVEFDRKRFLLLAWKKLVKTATVEEAQELAETMRTHPELNDDFAIMRSEHSRHQDDQIVELALRTLCRMPTNTDLADIELLKNEDGRRWAEYEHALTVLEAIVVPIPEPEPPPISPATRAKVLEEIAKLKNCVSR